MENGIQTYNSISPAPILKVLRDLEQFIFRDDKIDILVKVVLTHYQLETIHPFMIQNGLLGRIFFI